MQIAEFLEGAGAGRPKEGTVDSRRAGHFERMRSYKTVLPSVLLLSACAAGPTVASGDTSTDSAASSRTGDSASSSGTAPEAQGSTRTSGESGDVSTGTPEAMCGDGSPTRLLRCTRSSPSLAFSPSKASATGGCLRRRVSRRGRRRRAPGGRPGPLRSVTGGPCAAGKRKHLRGSSLHLRSARTRSGYISIRRSCRPQPARTSNSPSLACCTCGSDSHSKTLVMRASPRPMRKTLPPELPL